MTTTPTSAWTLAALCWLGSSSHCSGGHLFSAQSGRCCFFTTLHASCACPVSGMKQSLRSSHPGLHSACLLLLMHATCRKLCKDVLRSSHPDCRMCAAIHACKPQEAVQGCQVVRAASSGQRQGDQPALCHQERHSDQGAQVQPGNGQLGCTGHTGRARRSQPGTGSYWDIPRGLGGYAMACLPQVLYMLLFLSAATIIGRTTEAFPNTSLCMCWCVTYGSLNSMACMC